MAWYSAGTISVINGSPTVTLTGGDALLNIIPDDGLVAPDGRLYPIRTINGAGSFELASNYLGATATGQAYTICPVAEFEILRRANIRLNELINDYQRFLTTVAAGVFPAGTLAQPGVRGEGHDGTGLVWNNDGTLSVSVNGVSAFTFDSGMPVGVVEALSDGTGIIVDSTDVTNPIISLNSAAIASLALADSAVQPAALNPKANASITISSGAGLTGGGDLTVNRTLALSSASIASLALADSAVQPSALGDAAGLNVGTAAGTVAAGNHTHPAATTSAAGFMAAADKTKLNGIAVGAQVNTVTSVNSQTGAVVLVKADVGLGNVDNTSDANKPVSTATQTALNAKAGTAVATTTVNGLMSGADKSKLNGIATGATANTGTVTSVGMSVPTGLSVGGSPVTSSGTLAITYAAGYQGYTSAEATKLSTGVFGSTLTCNSSLRINAGLSGGYARIYNDSGELSFANGNSGETRKAYISPEGNFHMGDGTIGSGRLRVAARLDGPVWYGATFWHSGDHTAIQFTHGGSQVGSITCTGGATAYNTSSDYRLKENLEPIDGALDRVMELNPCRFNWIALPDGPKVDGFIAHEAAEVVPEAVTGTKDEMRTVNVMGEDEDGAQVVVGTQEVPEYQGIDQAKLVPLLTAAIQELAAKVAALEAANA